MRTAVRRAGITKQVRAFHDLRHTALTHTAASGAPAIYVQARAGHSQAAVTERYLHAAQVAFPGVVERAEARLFGELGVETWVEGAPDTADLSNEKAPFPGPSQ
jgi:hypothetical protein